MLFLVGSGPEKVSVLAVFPVLMLCVSCSISKPCFVNGELLCSTWEEPMAASCSLRCSEFIGFVWSLRQEVISMTAISLALHIIRGLYPKPGVILSSSPYGRQVQIYDHYYFIDGEMTMEKKGALPKREPVAASGFQLRPL